jgi:hypothetical protein
MALARPMPLAPPVTMATLPMSFTIDLPLITQTTFGQPMLSSDGLRYNAAGDGAKELL